MGHLAEFLKKQLLLLMLMFALSRAGFGQINIELSEHLSWRYFICNADCIESSKNYLGFRSLNSSSQKQKFLIMPLDVTKPITAASFVIANLESGDVITANSNPVFSGVEKSPVQLLKFTGSKYQLFKLSQSPSGNWQIDSKKILGNVLAVKDRFTRPYIGKSYLYTEPWTGTSNQEFQLIRSSKISNPILEVKAPNANSIALPKFPKSLIEELPIKPFPNHFVGEAVLPFVYVKEVALKSQAVKEFPYYRVIREDYWEKVADVVSNNFIPESLTFQVRQGMNVTEVADLERVLRIGFSIDGLISSKRGDVFSLQNAQTLSNSFSSSVILTESFLDNQERSDTITIQKPAGIKVRIVAYSLVSEYKLYRGHQQTPIKTWALKSQQELRYLEEDITGNIRIPELHKLGDKHFLLGKKPDAQ